MDKFRELFREHKWSVVLTVIGAVIVTLMLTVGFWKTILISIIIGLCFTAGFILDSEGISGFGRIFRQLFRKDK